jgi:hypothetical protein
VGYRVEGGDLLELDGSVELAEFAGEYCDDGTRKGVRVERGEVAGAGGEYPRWRVKYLGSAYYRGYRVASFGVYPFRYDLETGRLTLERDLRLVVETGYGMVDTGRLERMRHVEGFREEAREDIGAMVVNPEDAAGYQFSDIVVDDGGRAFLPSYLPSMEGSEVKYVIVTNEEMSAAFERLADWKTQKGVPAVVRTIEWISQNYRSGADLGESIRIFLQEAYAKWGVEYVLLGGDTEIIPARYAYVTFYTGDNIPTDMYYSCLDGTWNADGDSLWGEAYHTAEDSGDDADLFSEVYLGRMTTTTLSQAQMLVDKVISYSTCVDAVSKGKFTFLAECVFPSNYSPGDDIILDGASITENIYVAYLEGNPDVTTSRLYETCALHPGTICLTRQTTIDSLNAGTNHVVHVGHGFKYNMSVGDKSILNYDAANLTNGDALFAMYLMNCTNVAFDTDCLAEYFLLNPNGGAFAVTGCSRSAFPSASRPYMDYYYYLLFTENMVNLGEVYTKSREPYTGSAMGETADRWTHFIYNYLGDPELTIFNGAGSSFTVTKPDSVYFGSNDITIDVSSSGMPYDSAQVCLYKEGDDYAYGATGPSGSILFEDFLVRSEGTIVLTVTGLNHCRYVDTIQVAEQLSPFLRLDKKLVHDYTIGNSDEILDAGETVELWLRLKNTGGANAEKLYAIVRTSDPNVSISDSVSVYPDITSNTKVYPLDPIEMSVSSGVTDETSLEFVVEIHDSTGGFWTEPFAMEVHAPELELYVNMETDSIPYGNGDGTISNSENFKLNIGVKNFGTGAAYGLSGVIRSLDAELVVVDSTSTYDEIGLLEVGYGEGFVLYESDRNESNYFTFELVDAYGRTFTKEMELRKPAKPVGVLLDASHGPTEIHVTWHPPGTDEDYRYLVYHSQAQGGPYDQISADLLLHTLYVDYGLDPSTRYYYVVETVDSCGNVSAMSDEITITTSPPQLTGWPNALGKETASSVKVGDITGDGRPEVVVGGEYVYAFHGNGIEVRDGDSQPITWGVLNTEGDNFTATVALAELDENQGLEIVGASWNTREIYVFDMDGAVLPGWPKSTTDLCWASPVAGDIDGDGDNEVVAYDVGGVIYIWHHDGTELADGDMNGGDDGVFYRTSAAGGWHTSTPALADMDEDGIVEVIACSPSDSIYCFNDDISSVTGWPVPVVDAGARISASPAVGDIDGDGHLELVVQSSSARVYGLNHDGTSMAGWPRWIYSNKDFVASPALADLTGDGKLEVVLPGMDSNLYIFLYNGTQLPNWPQVYTPDGGWTESSPVIAEIDGDGELDIVIASEAGYLNAWDIDGNMLAGFPIQVGSYLRGTPMVKDLDLDGDLELVTSCWDKNIYAWDLEARYYYECQKWNGFHGNLANTGWKEFVQSTGVEGLAYTYRFTGGMVEFNWSVVRGAGAWDLHRKPVGGEYELLRSGLEADEAGIIVYTDRIAEEGERYIYRLESQDDALLVMETDEIEVPVVHARLYQNVPNPFNPQTMITFTVPGSAGVRRNVRLVVYDVRGARVKTLVSGAMPGGRHTVEWDGRNGRGEQVASGVYFARIAIGQFRATRKMVLLR